MSAVEARDEKIEGILKYLGDCLEERFDQACRINPNLARIRKDLIWHEMSSLRQVFSQAKAFGPEKFVVVDILTGYDTRKIAMLYSMTDTQSFFAEIVTEAESEKNAGHMEGLPVRDIGSFYKAVDPSLGGAVLLVQMWIWWDIKDAIDLYLLDLQLQRVRKLSKMEMNTSLLAMYREAMQEPEKDLSIKDILQYELLRTRQIAQRVCKRREDEPGYQIIISRKPDNNEEFETQVLALAHHMRVIEQLAKPDSLDASRVAYYSKALHCPAEEIDIEKVMEYEGNCISSLKISLRKLAKQDLSLGKPHNYKKSLLPIVRDKVARVEKLLKAANVTSATPEPTAS